MGTHTLTSMQATLVLFFVTIQSNATRWQVVKGDGPYNLYSTTVHAFQILIHNLEGKMQSHLHSIATHTRHLSLFFWIYCRFFSVLLTCLWKFLI